MMRQFLVARPALPWLPVPGLLPVAGGVTEPPRPVCVRDEAPPPDSNVYFYRARGHAAPSPEQQDRDKYDCDGSAVQQTCCVPSMPNSPPHQRMRLVAGGPDAAAGKRADYFRAAACPDARGYCVG